MNFAKDADLKSASVHDNQNSSAIHQEQQQTRPHSKSNMQVNLI